MNRCSLTVTKTILGEGKTWAYPSGGGLGTFLIPIYKLVVNGTDGSKQVTQDFPVFRFGVQCEDGVHAHVVGLAEKQTHTIKAWLGTYKVHSFRSSEDGAWQVYDSFLIHDGPDDDTEVFATIGCVEVMGPKAFTAFNDLLISLMDPPGADRDARLTAIGRSGKLIVSYEKAERPALKKAP